MQCILVCQQIFQFFFEFESAACCTRRLSFFQHPNKHSDLFILFGFIYFCCTNQEILTCVKGKIDNILKMFNALTQYSLDGQVDAVIMVEKSISLYLSTLSYSIHMFCNYLNNQNIKPACNLTVTFSRKIIISIKNFANANIIQIYENKNSLDYEYYVPNNDLAQQIQQPIPKLWRIVVCISSGDLLIC